MVASYFVSGEEFSLDRPRVWSATPLLPRQRDRSFDVHPDGVRAAVALPASVEAPEGEDHVTLIFNFFEELKRLVPTE
jgi:hypothetical protein